MSERSSPCDGFEDVCLTSDEEQESEEGDSERKSVVAAKPSEFRLSIVELDGEPAVLLGPIEDYELEADVLLSSIQDYCSETAVLQDHIQQYENEDATLLSSTQDFDNETDVPPPASIEQHENEAAVLLSSIQDFDDSDSDDTCSSYYSAVSSLSDLDETPCLGPADDPEDQTPEVENPVSVVDFDSDIAASDRSAVKPPEVKISASVLEFDSDVAAPPATTQECDDKTAEFQLYTVELDGDPAVPLGTIPEYESEAEVFLSPVQVLDSEAPVTAAPIQQYENEAAVHLSFVQDFNTPEDKICPPCPEPADRLAVITPEVNISASVLESDSDIAPCPARGEEYDYKTAHCETAFSPARIQDNKSEDYIPLLSILDFNTPEDKMCPPCPEPADRPAVKTPEVKISASVLEFDSDIAAPPKTRQECDDKTTEFQLYTVELDDDPAVPSGTIPEYESEAKVFLTSIEDSGSETAVPSIPIQKNENEAATLLSPVQVLDSETPVTEAPIQQDENEGAVRLSFVQDFNTPEDKICPPCPEPADRPAVKTPEVKISASVLEFDSDIAPFLARREEYDYKTAHCETAFPPARIQDNKSEDYVPLLSILDFNTPEDKMCPPCPEPADRPAVKPPKVKISASVLEFDSDIAAPPKTRQECDDKTAEFHLYTVELDDDPAVPSGTIPEYESEAKVFLTSIEDSGSETAVPSIPIQENENEAATLLSPVQVLDSETPVTEAPIQQDENEAAVRLSFVQDFNTPEDKICPPCPEPSDCPAVITPEVEISASVLEFDSDIAAWPAPRQEYENKTAQLHTSTQKLDFETAVPPARGQDNSSEANVPLLSMQDFNTPEDKVCPPCPETANHPKVKTPVPVLEFDSDITAPPASRQQCVNKTAECHRSERELDSETALPQSPIREYESESDAPLSSIKDFDSETAVLQVAVQKDENEADVLLLSTQEYGNEADVLPSPVQEAVHSASIQEHKNEADALLSSKHNFETHGDGEKRCSPCLEPDAPKVKTPELKIPSPVLKFGCEITVSPAPSQEYDNTTIEFRPSEQKFDLETAIAPASIQEFESDTAVLLSSTQEFNIPEDKICPPCPESADCPEVEIPAPLVEFCRDIAAPPHRQDYDNKTAEFPLPIQKLDRETALPPAPIQEYKKEADAPVSSIQDFNSENPVPTEKDENNAAVLSSTQECDKKTAVLLSPTQECEKEANVLLLSTQELDSGTAVPQVCENKAALVISAAQDFDSETVLFPAPEQRIDCKTAVLPLQSSSAISPELSDSDISYSSPSVPGSCKPLECSVSLNSVSASRACSLTHHVLPVLPGTHKTFEKTAHNTDIGSVQTGHVPLSKPSQSPKINIASRDIVKVSMTTHADTDTREGFCSPPPSSSLDTILITPEGNQYSRDRAREISGKMPTEVPPRQGPRLAEVPGSRVAERGRPSQAQPMGDGLLEVGEGQGMVASCRVEQTELSVRDRNRKASASCIPTLTGDARKSGIPPHCYSECILATGQQHQPQSPPQLQRWQKQSSQVAWRSRVLPQKVSGSSRKDFSTTQQSSGKNNMGTKLSQTDSEVKTLSNLPAKTFSCPDTNYLDVNNLTCPPSTEPCTDNSFNGWAEDNHCFKLPMPSSQSQNNTSACSEASSVECIVVALETHEEVQRGSMKTVPKRQIQLKRKDAAELSANEDHDHKPQEAPPVPSRPRDIFLRQHSTPAAFHQESHGPEQRSVQAVRKQRLQKSLSLDETSSKTKMASCLIKNVLSKKMQHEQGFRSAGEVQENAIATLKAQANGHVNYQPAKEISTEPVTKMSSSSTVSTQHTVPSQSPPPKAPVGSIKEHISVSSKTQQKPMIRHSFNPLHRALGRGEFQSDSPEITPVVDSKKAEKPTPRDEAVRLPCWSPGEKLSCDSAKGKAWKPSAVISKATGSKACLKATPEECGTGNGNLKQQQQPQQQQVNNQPAPKTWEKDVKKDKLSGTTDVPPQKISNLRSEEVNSDERLQPQIPECLSGSGKEQQIEKGEVKVPAHFGNSSTHDKLKGIAPVHVVRDVRSLVKNTYNLSFRGSDDTPLGCEDGPGILKAVAPQCQRAGDRGNALGSGDKQLGKKVPTSAPVKVEKRRDKSSHHNGPRGGLNKLDTGFTKVSPNSLFAGSSCLESSSMEGMASSAGLCKLDAPSDNTKCKHTDRAERPPQEPSSSSSSKLLIDGDVLPDIKQQEPLEQGLGPGEGEQSPPQVIPLHGFAAAAVAAPQCFASTTLLRDTFQSPSLTPVLTAALSPAQVLPAYYYKANTLSYPAISTHVGTVGFVQGPMILQASAQAIPSAGTGTLVKHITEDSQRASLNCHAEKRSGQKGSPKQQTGSGENRESVVSGEPKRPSPEAQQYLCGTQTIVVASEGRRSSTGTLYPELGGGGLIQGQAAGPRHLLVDPETGRCFYMDVPPQPQPQRKMLFDPETCQYVEVLLPQQTMPSAVMSPTCAVPLPFSAVYTPNCLPYLQSHTQVLPHPGP